jgi:DNA transformation protein
MTVKHDGFKEFVLDQLRELRGVTCRAMFGGYGLYRHGIFFGIIYKGRLYFRVTPATIQLYHDRDMEPFRPKPDQTLKTFYEVPVDILEDAEQVADWAPFLSDGRIR